MYEREHKITFVGPLRKQCKQFVGQKKALGLKYETEAYIMTVFDKFLLENDAPADCLPKEFAVEFAAKKEDESDKSFSNRASLVRQFGEFMVRMGYDAYILPSFRIFKSSFVPHIYTQNELVSIFSALDRIKPYHHSNAHKTYPVIFRVLYCCGLRVNEALKLKVKEVDLNNGVFTIKNAKWDTERLVPMSDSLLKICRKYYNEMHSAGSHEYFFPAKDGGFHGAGSLLTRLKKILLECEIPSTARVHDFRHTFAVHVLNRWANDGDDICVCLPILSKYMGHASIAGTERYLRLTADVYPDVVGIFENHFGGVIPEVRII